MAFTEVFKLLLDNKDFIGKIDEIEREWQSFVQKVQAKDISFRFNDQSFIDFKEKIKTNVNSLAKIAEDINEKFKININTKAINKAVEALKKEKFDIKLDDGGLLRSVKAERDKAQAALDRNPLTVLEKVKIDLSTLKKNASAMVAKEIGIDKEKIAKNLKDLETVLGKGFLASFKKAGSTNDFAKQIELVEDKLLKLGKATSKAAKNRAELHALFTDLDGATQSIIALTKESQQAQAKLNFFEKLRGFSPAFIDSLETVLRLQQKINAGDSVKSKTLETAGKRFQKLAEFEAKRLSNAQEFVDAETKIVEEGEAARLRVVEKAGKTRLELVKRVGFKITEANGATFRPLGEAVTDFSTAAEDALARAKNFADQAKTFKVPATNPLSQENIKKHVSAQELLNQKIKEFIQLQAKIRELEDKTAGLALKKTASEGVTFEQAGELHDAETDLSKLKADSLNLTAELNTLQKQSLATEKQITAELVKQLRLNSENKKTFTEISSKADARLQKLSALSTPTTELPNVPSAQAARDNFKELERIQAQAKAKEAEVIQAALDLRRAQNSQANAQEVKDLKDNLNSKLGALRKFNADFEKITGQLPKQINKANADAQNEFNNIKKSAEKAAEQATLAAEQARTRVSAQESKVRGLIERGATKEVVDEHKLLAEQLRAISVRREQDEKAAQERLVRIQQEGTLKKLQAAKLDIQPNIAKTTDNLSALVDNFEQQLPKVRQLILKRLDIERRGNDLSLQLSEARNADEIKLIEDAQKAQVTAAANTERDINDAKKGIVGQALKDREAETKASIKEFETRELAAISATKRRVAEEQRLERQNKRALAGQEKKLGLEKAALSSEQTKRIAFEEKQKALLTNNNNSQIVESAKNLHKSLLALEEARLQRIRAIENEITRIRSRGIVPSGGLGGGGGGGRPPGPPPLPPGAGGPPVIPPPPNIAPFLASIRLGQKEFDKLNSKGSFFNDILKGFEKNLGQSIGSVIKFQLAWRITGGVISAATAPLFLIGDTLKRGLEFLINLQDKAADLREVLVLNVKFSNDLALNFERAGEAARFLVLQQEELSAQIGVGLDKFQSVFESFAASGGLKAVKEAGKSTEETFTRANRSVALIITALNSVGVSTKDTRRATENTNKLLEGRVKTADKIRIASGLTADELNRQSLEAQKAGKFAEFIERIFAAQAKRIETSNQRLSTLISQLRVVQGRVGAIFVQPAFELLITAVQKLIQLLKDSEEDLAKFARHITKLFSILADAVTKVSDLIGSVLLVNIKQSVEQFQIIFDTIVLISQKITELLSGESFGGPIKIGLFRAISIGISEIAGTAGAVAQFIQEAIFKMLTVAKIVKRDVRLLVTAQTTPSAPVVEDPANPRGRLQKFASSTATSIRDFFSSRTGALAVQEKQDKEDIAAFNSLLKQKELMEKTYSDDRIRDAKLLDKRLSAISAADSDTLREKLTADLKNFQESIDREEKIRIDSLVKIDDKISKLRLNPAVESAEVGDIFTNLDRNLTKATERTAELLDDSAATINKKLEDFTQLPRERAGDGDKTKFDNDRLNELNERVREAFEQITQRTELFNQKQRTLQEARVQSEAETEENIARILDRQDEDLQRITQAAIDEAKKFTEADPRAREKFVNTINTRLLDLEGKGEVEREKLRTDAAKRRVKLDDDQFRFEIQRERQNAQARLEQLQEALNREQITRVQFIRAQIEEVRDQTALTKEELEKQLLNDGISVTRRQELQQQLQRAEEEGNNRISVLRRQLAAEDEILLRRRQQLVLEDLTLERSRIQTIVELQEQGIVSDQQRLENQVRLTEASRNLADAQLAEAERQLQQAISIESTTEAIKAQEQAVEALRQAQLRAAIDQRVAAARANRSTGRRLLEDLTGIDTVSGKARREAINTEINVALDSLDVEIDPAKQKALENQIEQLTIELEHLSESGLTKFGNAVLNVVNTLQNAVSAVIQGFQEGGVGGAIGAGLTQVGTIFSETLKAGGPIVQAAGAVVSVIASAFTAAARRLAAKIKKDFDKTLEAFRDESVSLGRTITALEAQRIAAIQRLSGRKGGKKQLEELLPEFDRAIKDLVKQQKEIQETFEDELGSLRLGNDALREFGNKWDEVNDKVQKYIDSFREGEFTLEKQANAVEFLSRSLEKLQGELLEELEDAEKEAIDNALELNELYKERLELIKEMEQAQRDFNNEVFNLINSDAIERRQSRAVEIGSKVAELKRQFEEEQTARKQRLADLNQEIITKQRAVDKAKQLFNISQSETALRNRQNILDERSLDRQIQRWKDIREIINGIQRGVDGNFTITPELLGRLNPLGGSLDASGVATSFQTAVAGFNATQNSLREAILELPDRVAASIANLNVVRNLSIEPKALLKQAPSIDVGGIEVHVEAPVGRDFQARRDIIDPLDEYFRSLNTKNTLI